jgi:hypothetical protein
MAGNDLRIMPQAIKDILLNKEAIAVDQDKLGIQGSKKLDEGSFEVWTKPLEDGDVAVILFNRGEKPINANVKWLDFGIEGIFTAHDLWKKSDLGYSTGFSGSLPSHDVVFLRLTKQYCQKAVSFKPGQLWPDNNGVHINAHGGGIIYYNDTYYWFGEHKIEGEKGNFAQVGVHCYSSKDLYNWTDEGISLNVDNDPGSEITKGCILERPKVVYNKKTSKFVMWFHLERLGYGYGYASSGIAVSDKVTGPYRFIRSVRPNQEQWAINIKEINKQPASRKVLETKYPGYTLFGDADSVNILGRDFKKGQMARDMTIFVDEDGKAYHIFASEENSTIHISELSDDYLSYTGKYARAFVGRFMEAPAVFKKDGKYYFVGSGCTGWAPNAARSAVADNIFGPWSEIGNPCVGADSAFSFHSQSTYVLPVAGKIKSLIFMADRWSPENAIDGRYIWLPINFSGSRIVIKWLDEWSLGYFSTNK